MIEWRERISPKIFSPSNQAVCHFGNPPFLWMMRIYPQRQHELQALLRLDVHGDLSGDEEGGGKAGTFCVSPIAVPAIDSRYRGDFLRESRRGTCINQKRVKPQPVLLFSALQYREWDLNPHSRFGPKDFHTNRSLLGLCLNRILADVGCGYIVSTHLGIFRNGSST